MRYAVRAAKGILAALGVATVTYPLMLLTLWQLVVTGLVDGPGKLLAVAVAGMVAGVGPIVAHELGHAGAAWAVGLPRVSLTLVPPAPIPPPATPPPTPPKTTPPPKPPIYEQDN